MLTILIHNDNTGTPEIGHYDYEVRLNDHIIVTGRVENHRRDDGWHALLVRVAADGKSTEEELNRIWQAEAGGQA